jgi:hypothetical protein
MTPRLSWRRRAILHNLDFISQSLARPKPIEIPAKLYVHVVNYISKRWLDVLGQAGHQAVLITLMKWKLQDVKYELISNPKIHETKLSTKSINLVTD